MTTRELTPTQSRLACPYCEDVAMELWLGEGGEAWYECDGCGFTVEVFTDFVEEG